MRIQAVITADIGNGQKRQVTIPRIEAYAIASAWTQTQTNSASTSAIRRASLASCLARYNEVIVSLFTRSYGGSSVEQLHQGIADTVTFSTDDQIMSIKGRDFSSVAVDSQAPSCQRESHATACLHQE
jgi:hypothetical protein